MALITVTKGGEEVDPTFYYFNYSNAVFICNVSGIKVECNIHHMKFKIEDHCELFCSSYCSIEAGFCCNIYSETNCIISSGDNCNIRFHTATGIKIGVGCTVSGTYIKQRDVMTNELKFYIFESNSIPKTFLDLEYTTEELVRLKDYPLDEPELLVLYKKDELGLKLFRHLTEKENEKV